MNSVNSILIFGIVLAICIPSSYGLNITGKLSVKGRLQNGDFITIKGKMLDTDEPTVIAFENGHCDWDFDTKQCISVLHQKLKYKGNGIEFVRSFYTWYNGGLVNMDISWVGPIEKEKDFMLQIFIEDSRYKQIFNGKVLPNIKWIYPLKTAEIIKVYGSTKIDSITWNK